MPGPAEAERGQEPIPPFLASSRQGAGPTWLSWQQRSVDTTTRNPLFVLRLSGSLLLRYEQRTFC